MPSAQLSFQQCLYHTQEMLHSTIYICIDRCWWYWWCKNNTLLLLYCKANYSTPEVITGHYIITTCSVFGQSIDVRYTPFLLILRTLGVYNQCLLDLDFLRWWPLTVVYVSLAVSLQNLQNKTKFVTCKLVCIIHLAMGWQRKLSKPWSLK